MKTLLRFRAQAIALAVLAIVVAFSSAGSAWWDGFDLGLNGTDSPIGETRSEQKRLAKMAEACDKTNQRFALRETIVADLLMGRRTLREAAEQFDAINQTHAPTLARVRSTFKGNTDEERSARHVIEFVGERLMQSPSQHEEALQQLECQYRAEYGRD